MTTRRFVPAEELVYNDLIEIGNEKYFVNSVSHPTPDVVRIAFTSPDGRERGFGELDILRHVTFMLHTV